MVKVIESTGLAREPIPEGTHLGALYQIINLGTSPDPFNEGRTKTRLMLGFEVPEVKDTEGIPRTVAAFVTNSNNEKSTLSKWLRSWIGVKQIDAGFNLNSLLSRGALLSIEHKETDNGIRDKITGVSSLMPGMSVPTLYHSTMTFDFEPDEKPVLKQLSDKTREQIEKTPEYAQAYGAQEIVQNNDSFGHVSQEIPA